MTASGIEQLCDSAWAHFDAGRAEQAGRLFQEILALDPNHAEAWMMTGVLQATSGQVGQALASLRRALEIDPDYPDPWLHLARLQLVDGDMNKALTSARRATRCDDEYGEAWVLIAELSARSGDAAGTEEAYRKLLQLDPGRADLHNRLGAVLLGQGRYAEAVQACREALRLDPGSAEIHANLGNVYAAQGDHVQAVACYEHALRLAPDFAGARLNLGNSLRETGEFSKAAECYQRLIDAHPDNVDAHLSQGDCYLKLHQMQRALVAYDAALALAPDHPVAWLNRGFVLGELQRYAEALEANRKVLSRDPRHVDAWFNRGLLEKNLGQFDAAADSLRRALELSPTNPDIQLALSLLELLRGNYSEGWRYYGARKSVRDRAGVDAASLSGELRGKRILLVKDQGIGDEIFFLRFAGLLKERGAWLACQTDTKIKTIIERTGLLDAVVSESEASPTVDLSLSIGDLPRALDLGDAKSVPPPVTLPVLSEQRDKMQRLLAQAGPAPWIGVTWWAGTRQTAPRLGDKLAHREAPLQALAQALRPLTATVLVLQRNPDPGDIREFSDMLGRPVVDLSHLNDDLEAMLALLALIDDYVGVDNTNMHLSAGIGKPCRILVPHPPEWRMMTGGHVSPWFPGFRLYRQLSGGEWTKAMAELGKDLGRGLR